MIEPCIGMVETNSIALGIQAADAMLKEADIKLVDAYPMCPGKYIILITGSVHDVEMSVEKGKDIAQDTLISTFIIRNVHPKIIPAILGTSKPTYFEAVGVVETFDVASCIRAADASVKAADVDLIELRLAKGLGGKSYYTMTGEVGLIRTAVDAGVNLIKNEGMLYGRTVITQAHPDILKAIYK